MNELMNERKSIMKKKIYSIPQTEVAAMAGTCNIMKTSIDLLPDMAPKRHTTEVF